MNDDRHRDANERRQLEMINPPAIPNMPEMNDVISVAIRIIMVARAGMNVALT